MSNSEVFKVAEREVAVWPVRLTASESVTARFAEILSPDETERAARFHFDHLRHSYVLSRGSLRVLLSRYLGTPPGQIRFRYGSRGKPAIVGAERIQFNVSHSGGIALFAFTLDCELGIDVEHVRPVSSSVDIAKRFFCAEETADILTLKVEDQDQAFFSCWTRKEAYIKALGEGLHVPLNSFRVTLKPGTPVQLTRLDPKGPQNETWTLQDINFLAGYTAALAYCDFQRKLRLLPVTLPDDLWDPGY